VIHRTTPGDCTEISGGISDEERTTTFFRYGIAPSSATMEKQGAISTPNEVSIEELADDDRIIY